MHRFSLILPLLLPLLIACGGERSPGEAVRDSGANGNHAGADTLAAPAIPYQVTPAQRDAITALLREHPQWRVADDADNRHEMLERMRQEYPGYRPYFTAHDFNGDGTGDFAITLLRDTTFRTYWFRGAADGYRAPVLLVEDSWPARGGQIIKDGTLIVGEFYSDHLIGFPPNTATGGLRAVVAPPPGNAR